MTFMTIVVNTYNEMDLNTNCKIANLKILNRICKQANYGSNILDYFCDFLNVKFRLWDFDIMSIENFNFQTTFINNDIETINHEYQILKFVSNFRKLNLKLQILD